MQISVPFSAQTSTKIDLSPAELDAIFAGEKGGETPSVWRQPAPLVAVVDANPKGVYGLSANDKWGDLPDNYRVTSLDDALSCSYSSDAHAVAYVVVDQDGLALSYQPRLTLHALKVVRAAGYDVKLTSLWADVDNAGHASWTPELLRDTLPMARKATSCAVYTSRAGLRFIQPLTRWLTPEEFQGVHQAWIKSLEHHTGLVTDKACKDWTRHYRLARVTRDGVKTKPLVRAKWTPIDPPTPATLLAAPKPALVARQAYLSSLGRPSGSVAAARSHLDRNPPPPCGSSSCHDACFARASSLVGYYRLDKATALSLLSDWARGSHHNWTIQELEHKLTDAAARDSKGGAK